MKIHAKYFYEAGQFYGSGETTLPDFTSPGQIGDLFLSIKPSPGLAGPGTWPGPIVLTSPGDSYFRPILIPGRAPISRVERAALRLHAFDASHGRCAP